MVKDDRTTQEERRGVNDETPRKEEGLVERANDASRRRHDILTVAHDIPARLAQHFDKANRAANVFAEMATGTGVERVLHRIRGQIESGAYYEAQQSYKTVYHRYKAKDLHRESHTVLEEGSCLLLENRQINGGIELGNMLLQSYEEGFVELDEAGMGTLRRLVELLPWPAQYPELIPESAEVEEGMRFLENSIRFLKKARTRAEWQHEMNVSAGDYVFNWHGLSVLGRITIFYARGQGWEKLIKVLSECLAEGEDSEEDLFVCRAALQILLYSNDEPVSGAAAFLKAYEQQKSIPHSPLINFIYFVIEALLIPSQSLVNMLRTKYARALDRDKHLNHLLAKVTEKFFPARENSLLSNLLDGLMGGSTTSA